MAENTPLRTLTPSRPLTPLPGAERPKQQWIIVKLKDGVTGHYTINSLNGQFTFDASKKNRYSIIAADWTDHDNALYKKFQSFGPDVFDITVSDKPFGKGTVATSDETEAEPLGAEEEVEEPSDETETEQDPGLPGSEPPASAEQGENSQQAKADATGTTEADRKVVVPRKRVGVMERIKGKG